jgi:capsular exopolysaccharide synthesis family protein
MTRITDALRRARNDSSGGAGHDDSRSGDTIQFFAPGQPAVDSPWDITEEPAGDLPDAFVDLVGETVLSDSRPARRDSVAGATAVLPARAWSEKLAISPSLSPVCRAQYSKLAAALHDTHRDRDIKVVMVISTGSGEGKTLTAANLALMFSEVFEKRVLLIDTDLRKPALHDLFGVSNSQGLVGLIDGDGIPPAIELSPRLSLLPAGVYRDDPTRLFTSERMWTLLEDARARFDWIVIDTPPLDFVAHARLLAPMTDGALLVARAGKTLYDEVQRAADSFDPKLLLGLVLNGVSEDTSLVTHGYYAAPEMASPTQSPVPNQP